MDVVGEGGGSIRDGAPRSAAGRGQMEPSGDFAFDHLSSAISHATAPAFMLGAVAAFLSILITRLERVIDRHRELRGSGDVVAEEQRVVASKSLRRRMKLLSRAIMFSVISAFVTAVLLVLSFLAGLLGLGHGAIVAIFFVIALVLMMLALADLAREVRIQIATMHLD
jgi:Protein of unknown function (DUF2721)